MAGVARGLRGRISRWASSSVAEADDLREVTTRSGCCLIQDARDREWTSLHGTLRTVTLRPRGGVPALEAELYDGSGVITLIWLGRRSIAGVNPGRQLRVAGRVGSHQGQPIMYNPRYELRY